MTSQEDYQKMREFFEDHLFDVHECIKIDNFSKLKLNEYPFFERYFRDGLGEILPFSSPLGNFYMLKTGPYGKWHSIKLISYEEYYGSTL